MKRRLVLSASCALLCLTVTPIAAQAAAPPPAPAQTTFDDCAALARALSGAAGVQVRPAVERGHGCALQGRAMGLQQRFDRTLDRATGAVRRLGWEPDPMADADGPDSAARVFNRGRWRLDLELATEPPAGVCEDVPVSACKAPARRWRWTVKAEVRGGR